MPEVDSHRRARRLIGARSGTQPCRQRLPREKERQYRHPCQHQRHATRRAPSPLPRLRRSERREHQRPRSVLRRRRARASRHRYSSPPSRVLSPRLTGGFAARASIPASRPARRESWPGFRHEESVAAKAAHNPARGPPHPRCRYEPVTWLPAPRPLPWPPTPRQPREGEAWRGARAPRGLSAKPCRAGPACTPRQPDTAAA